MGFEASFHPADEVGPAWSTLVPTGFSQPEASCVAILESAVALRRNQTLRKEIAAL